MAKSFDFGDLRNRMPVDKKTVQDMLAYFVAINGLHEPNPKSGKNECPSCSVRMPCNTAQLLNTYRMNLTVRLEELESEVEGRLF